MKQFVHLHPKATIVPPSGHEASINGGPWCRYPLPVWPGESVRIRRICKEAAEDMPSDGQMAVLVLIAALTIPFTMGLLAWVVP